jgi:hypothetical protein
MNYEVRPEHAAVVLTFVLVLIACASHESDWASTRRQSSVAGYEAFLEQYPDSPHAEEARRNIDSLGERKAYEEAKRENTPESWAGFLNAYPTGELSASAEIELQRREGERRRRKELEGQFQQLRVGMSVSEVESIIALGESRPLGRDLELLRMAVEVAGANVHVRDRFTARACADGSFSAGTETHEAHSGCVSMDYDETIDFIRNAERRHRRGDGYELDFDADDRLKAWRHVQCTRCWLPASAN